MEEFDIVNDGRGEKSNWKANDKMQLLYNGKGEKKMQGGQYVAV